MSKWNSVAIVGVGLIGGSIGAALLRRQLAERVIGVGRRDTSLDRALACGVVTETTRDVTAAAQEADLVVVCTPVEVIPDVVVTAGQVTNCLITDAGSTKRWLLDQIAARWPDFAERFVASHPLAGSDKGGPEYADSELFVDRTAVVTPVADSPPNVVEQISQLWESLGSRVDMIDPDEHDKAMAAVSHLPHLVAAALASATPSEWLPLVASGWRDTTRVAAGDVELWSQIVNTNRAPILAAVDRFIAQMEQFREAVRDANAQQWEDGLHAGKVQRDRVAD